MTQKECMTVQTLPQLTLYELSRLYFQTTWKHLKRNLPKQQLKSCMNVEIKWYTISAFIKNYFAGNAMKVTFSHCRTFRNWCLWLLLTWRTVLKWDSIAWSHRKTLSQSCSSEYLNAFKFDRSNYISKTFLWLFIWSWGRMLKSMAGCRT